MDDAWSEAPSERAIAAFLDDYEQEIALRQASEREFGPLSSRLCSLLERWTSGEVGADETRDARARYLEALRRWQPDLEHWVAIRGSGDRLLAAVEFMTDAQWLRFSALQAAEMRSGISESSLDRDQAVIRSLLPRFEASLPPES
ncbi:MAG: hypothetical protein U0446_00635 [Dehalococcoidia bacterium]